jgi:hypothetical protein
MKHHAKFWIKIKNAKQKVKWGEKLGCGGQTRPSLPRPVPREAGRDDTVQIILEAGLGTGGMPGIWWPCDPYSNLFCAIIS